MRLATLCIAAVLAAGHPAWGQQPGKDGDPTPRRSLDPIDAAKVKQFEAKRWLDFGARSAGSGIGREQLRPDTTGSIPGRRSCTTQIGPSANESLGPGGRSVDTPRFGQRRDAPVIITGSVINVCR